VEVFGGLPDGRLVFPEDGRAALGRNNRIIGVFEHEDPVADADAQRPAASSLADDQADDRHPEPGHDLQVVGDRLGLAPLLGPDAGISALRVNESNDWKAEFFRFPEDAIGFAVPLGIHLAEVAVEPFAGRPALLMAHDGYGPPLIEGQSGDQGRIIGEPAVPVHLHEIGCQGFDVIEGHRPLGMPGDLNDLTRDQAGLDFPPFGLDLKAQSGRFFIEAGFAGQDQGVDLFFQGDDRFFKRVEILGFRH
jgi:hypothetical protein